MLLFVYLFIYLFIHLFIYSFIHLFMYSLHGAKCLFYPVESGLIFIGLQRPVKGGLIKHTS